MSLLLIVTWLLVHFVNALSRLLFRLIFYLFNRFLLFFEHILLLVVLISCCFPKDIFQNGFRFWINSLFEDSLQPSWLRELIGWTVQGWAFKLCEAWDGLFYLDFKFLRAIVDWIDGHVNIGEVFQGLSKVFNARPIRNLIVIDPELV